MNAEKMSYAVPMSLDSLQNVWEWRLALGIAGDIEDDVQRMARSGELYGTPAEVPPPGLSEFME